jgi:hypothetical protein
LRVQGHYGKGLVEPSRQDLGRLRPYGQDQLSEKCLARLWMNGATAEELNADWWGQKSPWQEAPRLSLCRHTTIN